MHPSRLAHALGGLYLLAYVPEYEEVRTFAVERIASITLLEERFTPTEDQSGAAFPDSLGVHSGPPERVEVEFDGSAAGYVRDREWHPSQTWRAAEAGGGVMTLDVCVDQALRAWILSFGAAARVIAPASLAAEIADVHRDAAARYEGGRG